jgi:hypothetical protein
MRCKVAYHVGKRPRRLTRWLTGILSIDDTGLRIDGPVAYRVDFSEVQWLDAPGKHGRFYIGVGSSPALFFTRIIYNLFGVIQVIHRPMNQRLYAELHNRVAGLGRCAVCGCEVRLSALPCPQCAAGGGPVGRSRFRLRLLAACALALLLGAYVGSYYHLSRRGMREAKEYNMKGFLYAPANEVFETRDLSGHYFRMRLYAPLNWLDRTLFGGHGPVRHITWGLSK